MTRDYSQFLPPTKTNKETKPDLPPLTILGWQPFFAQQISIEQMEDTPPVRITEVHRNGLRALGDGIDIVVPPRADATVGDWLLLDQTLPKASAILDRKSLIKRRAPGKTLGVQLIAANLDTAFIVSSCNDDFNIARLERFVAMVLDADVSAVIVLTKLDLCEAPEQYVSKAEAISPFVPVLVLDARGTDPVSMLADWCKPGQTVAFLGSSGVGKSTLVNALSGALSGAASIPTQPIREDDARGRHTTTHRQLHILPSGCAVMDMPGIREIQLTDVASGVAETFLDLDEIAGQCRFNDCQHIVEPGCAIQAAAGRGEITVDRISRWQKLVIEEQRNSATLAERRDKDKNLGKMIRSIKKKNRK